MNTIRVTWRNNLGGDTKDFKKESSALAYLRKLRREHPRTDFQFVGTGGKIITYIPLKLVVNIEIIKEDEKDTTSKNNRNNKVAGVDGRKC